MRGRKKKIEEKKKTTDQTTERSERRGKLEHRKESWFYCNEEKVKGEEGMGETEFETERKAEPRQAYLMNKGISNSRIYGEGHLKVLSRHSIVAQRSLQL